MNIKNIITLNRNGKGQFLSNYSKSIKFIAIIYILAGIAYLLATASNYMVKNTLTIQKPIVVSIETRPMVVVEERKPLLLLSPYRITKPVAVETVNMNDAERAIYEVFGLEDYKMALAIAKAESGLKVHAFHANDNGSIDLGIFQINSVHFNKPGCSMNELVTVMGNVKCAKQIYDAQGWAPWVVFQTGAFINNL